MSDDMPNCRFDIVWMWERVKSKRLGNFFLFLHEDGGG